MIALFLFSLVLFSFGYLCMVVIFFNVPCFFMWDGIMAKDL